MSFIDTIKFIILSFVLEEAIFLTNEGEEILSLSFGDDSAGTSLFSSDVITEKSGASSFDSIGDSLLYSDVIAGKSGV